MITSGGGFDPDNPGDLRRLNSPLDHLGDARSWKKWANVLQAVELSIEPRPLQAGNPEGKWISGSLMKMARNQAAIAERARAAWSSWNEPTAVAREMLRLLIQKAQQGEEDFEPFGTLDRLEDFEPFAKFDPAHPEAVNLPPFQSVNHLSTKLVSSAGFSMPQDPRRFRQVARTMREEWAAIRDEDPFPFALGQSSNRCVSHADFWIEQKRQTVVLPETIVEYAWDRAVTMEFGKYEPSAVRDSRFFLFAQPKVVWLSNERSPVILAGFLITRPPGGGSREKRVAYDGIHIHAVTTFTMAEMLSGATEYTRFKEEGAARIVQSTYPMLLLLGQFTAGSAIEGLMDLHTGGSRISSPIFDLAIRNEQAARDVAARLAKLAISCLVVTNAMDNQASFITGSGADIRPPRAPRGSRRGAPQTRYKTLYLSKGAQQTLQRKWYKLHKRGLGGKGAPPGYVPAHFSIWWVKRGSASALKHLEIFPDDEIESRRHPDPDKAHLYWVSFERSGWGDEAKAKDEVRPMRTLIKKLRPGTRLGKGVVISRKKP
ncbi:MAG TPA: hypothetical protein EYF98_11490 [Planctomycetes bacterium]|nr:hypothetical protein [Planctomycetota bacterium]